MRGRRWNPRNRPVASIAVADADTPSRSERVLNLLALLLDRPRPVARVEILTQIGGYPGDNEAGRRAFERDKEMLRSMGVPIKVVGGSEAAEQAYTVDPDEYYLPALGLTDEETAALRVAVSAVALGSGAGEGALLKLGALAGDSGSPIAALPLVPQLAPLFDAFRRRCVATFTYRGVRRTMEPWALSSHHGRWYVVGFDRDRTALRTFRADRVANDVKLGPPDAFTVPDDFRPDDVGRERPWQFGDEHLVVRMAVDATHVDDLVAALAPDVQRSDRDDGSSVLTIEVANRRALRSTLLGFEDHVEVLEPEELRRDITSWLERVIAATAVPKRKGKSAGAR
jgi:predicted DNA-binding transcriptional regulator YafY